MQVYATLRVAFYLSIVIVEIPNEREKAHEAGNDKKAKKYTYIRNMSLTNEQKFIINCR